MSETAKSVQDSTAAPKQELAVRTVSTGDILEILAAGLRDFRAAFLYDIAVSGIYVVGGWVLILLLFQFDLPFLVYPLAAGFALIAPHYCGRLLCRQPQPGAKRTAVLGHHHEIGKAGVQ